MQCGSSLIRGSRARWRFLGLVYWLPSRSASTRTRTMASLAMDCSACRCECTGSKPSMQPVAASCEYRMAACWVSTSAPPSSNSRPAAAKHWYCSRRGHALEWAWSGVLITLFSLKSLFVLYPGLSLLIGCLPQNSSTSAVLLSGGGAQICWIRHSS